MKDFKSMRTSRLEIYCQNSKSQNFIDQSDIADLCSLNAAQFAQNLYNRNKMN